MIFSAIAPTDIDIEEYRCTKYEVKVLFWIMIEVQNHPKFQELFHNRINGHAVKIPDEYGGIRSPAICSILAVAMTIFVHNNDTSLYIAGPLHSKYRITKARLKAFIAFLSTCGGYTLDTEGEEIDV